MSKPLGETRVIVIEDQMEARVMMRGMLADLGINQVFEAKDGREGLEFLSEAQDMIDVIICDWKMPHMTGIELLKQVRTVDPAMPFIMITGRADLESVMAAKTAGVSSFIKKPFSPKQLELKLRIAARQREEADAAFG